MFMHIKRTIIGISVLIIIVLIAWAIVENSAPATPLTTGGVEETMSLEEYLKANISALSPVSESLGGKFYVTKVENRNGEGTVYYEDGHSAYIADFTYSTDEGEVSSMETFTVRK